MRWRCVRLPTWLVDIGGTQVGQGSLTSLKRRAGDAFLRYDPNQGCCQ